MYPRGFLSYVTPGSRCRLQSIPLSVLAAHAGCGYNRRPAGVEDEDDALLLMGDGYEPRSAERESALVTVLSDTPSAISQMPRGNLEALYPIYFQALCSQLTVQEELTSVYILFYSKEEKKKKKLL